MLSSMPAAIVPQAVFTAVRNASSSVVPEAVAQLLFPLKVTQASHSTCCADSVEYSRSPAKPRARRMVITVLFFMANRWG
jgi:hypothetical protein